MSVKKILIGCATVVVLTGGSAWAVSESDEVGSPTGPDAKAAEYAGAAAVPGGVPRSVERDNEDGATWEVEVVRADGSSFDVRLAADFSVVTIEADVDRGDE